jgi:hypothetical protein
MKGKNILVTLLAMLLLGVGLGYGWCYYHVNKHGVIVHVSKYEIDGKVFTIVDYVKEK